MDTIKTFIEQSEGFFGFLQQLITIGLIAVMLYFVIKLAVRKGIAEAKYYEKDLLTTIQSDEKYKQISEFVNGTDGFGTDAFEGLNKEQKKSFKDDFKNIKSHYNKMNYTTNRKKQREEIDMTLSLIDDLTSKIKNVK